MDLSVGSFEYLLGIAGQRIQRRGDELFGAMAPTNNSSQARNASIGGIV
ncbi:MAG: hypothetical protein ACRD3O_10660 [Terriglobia bacterium]